MWDETLLRDDDAWLLSRYADERGMPYPFPSSARRIAYVPVLGSIAAAAEVMRSTDTWRAPQHIYEATEQAAAHFASQRGQFIFEGKPNVRLSGLERERRPIIRVQPVRYDDYARTNLVMDYGGEASLRALVHKGQALDTFEDSVLANSIGINVLAINAEGDIPLQVRTSSVALRPGAVCSTASGGLEVGDLPASRCRLADCNLKRELSEEFGAAFSAACAAPRLIGLARELSRGGQPELFAVSEGQFTRDDAVRGAREGGGGEVASVVFLRLPRGERGTEMAAASLAIDVFERQYGAFIAPPLRAHIALLFNWLGEEGALAGAPSVY